VYFVDQSFLESLQGPESPIREVCVPAGEPFFDIALFGDACLSSADEASVNGLVSAYEGHLGALSEGQPPHLLISAGDLVKVTDRDLQGPLLAAAVDAFTSMGCDPRTTLLSVPGNHDVKDGVANYYQTFVSRVVRHVGDEQLPARPGDHPVAAVFRVLRTASARAGLPDIPLAYVAVVGFDSNHGDAGAYDYGQVSPEQLAAFRVLIRTLRAKVSHCAPLYVLAVTHHNVLPIEDRRVLSLADAIDAHEQVTRNVRNTSANASGLLEECRRLRTSLLMHAHMHKRDVLDIASTPLDPRRLGAELTVVAAPTLQGGRSMSGMARIRLDLAQGSMELAVDYARGPDGEPGVPVQTTRKLTSASRISAGERRLYDAASKVIRQAMDLAGTGDPEQAEWLPRAERYREHVAQVWRLDGCVPLSVSARPLPQLSASERRTRYNLLLLLRERAGRYEILLSRHTPLKPSEVGAWDTLLMPAFTNARALLEHLHDDVVRQVAARSTDLAKAASGREFVAAVREILATQDAGGGLWADEYRELGQLESRKLSPTTGQITRSEYHLVVLLPFVQETRPTSDERERNNYRTVMNWLNELPSIKLAGEPLTGHGSIPIEALYRGGSGLRWEPSADLGDDASDLQVRQSRPMSPGGVWFPLPPSDETGGAWARCPLIEHRNLDVLTWVKAEIDKRRDIQGRYPPHLLLGRFAGQGAFQAEPGGLLPFEASGGERVEPPAPARSTVEALERVRYLESSDLQGQPYAGMEFRRVALQRRPLDRGPGRGAQDVIMVFDMTELAGTRDLAGVPGIASGQRLGILRPVQRFVMRAGLQRAKTVIDFHQELAADVVSRHDPWGFLLARYGEFGETLALTPPILEQLWTEDTQFDPPLVPDGHVEFVLCDGNHRVVQTVWIDGGVLAAVAVVGRLPQPYYALPFSAYEWENTASQVEDISPPVAAKYAARKPDRDADEHDPDWYRRYYRDLSTGFGNVGSQGGRA
jgi:hypothetical protein